MRQNVAWTPCAASRSRTCGVQRGSGPSSMVSATELPGTEPITFVVGADAAVGEAVSEVAGRAVPGPAPPGWAGGACGAAWAELGPGRAAPSMTALSSSARHRVRPGPARPRSVSRKRAGSGRRPADGRNRVGTSVPSSVATVPAAASAPEPELPVRQPDQRRRHGAAPAAVGQQQEGASSMPSLPYAPGSPSASRTSPPGSHPSSARPSSLPSAACTRRRRPRSLAPAPPGPGPAARTAARPRRSHSAPG